MRALIVFPAVFLSAFSAGFFAPDVQISAAPAADPVVKITDGKGHGSAVHIGNGYYLTAAHVTAGKDVMTAHTNLGTEGEARVLWSSREYDISLLKADDLDGVASVNLECRSPVFGESLELRGNPQNLEHISTFGRVSGASVTLDGFWKSAIPVNASMISGMSGGAVFDADGDLVGINVGGMIMRVGMGGGPAGIGYIVPGDAICGLLGRLA